MTHIYYLGSYDSHTRQFNKNIPVQIWTELRGLTTKKEEQNYLKYYTLMNCFVKNQNSGDIFLEEYPTMTIQKFPNNHWQFLEIEYNQQKVPIIPAGMEFFNKQVYTTFETTYNDKIVLFSQYLEKGTTYCEIASPDLNTLVQLSSALSSSS